MTQVQHHYSRPEGEAEITTLSLWQQDYLESLGRSTSHPISVLEPDVPGDMVVHLTFPGIYLTVDLGGNLLRTETERQWSARTKDGA